MRAFSTGATRDVDLNKYDYEGFLSPLVLDAYGRYMNACRVTAVGLRDSDNWQKGIPLVAYMKSAWRHFFSWWGAHRRECNCPSIITDLCAVIFNASGYLHEFLKAHPELLDVAIKEFERARAVEIEQRKRDASASPAQ